MSATDQFTEELDGILQALGDEKDESALVPETDLEGQARRNLETFMEQREDE